MVINNYCGGCDYTNKIYDNYTNIMKYVSLPIHFTDSISDTYSVYLKYLNISLRFSELTEFMGEPASSFYDLNSTKKHSIYVYVCVCGEGDRKRKNKNIGE